jgi:hypothetical protein
MGLHGAPRGAFAELLQQRSEGISFKVLAMEPILANLKWHQPIESSTRRIGEYQWADLSTAYQVVEALLGCGILHNCYYESHIAATVKIQIPCRLRIHISLSLVSVYAIFFPCFIAQIFTS